PALARGGQVAAALGATASFGALVHDLGRPERFLHMLRVVKPTSPLNTGSWLLAGYGTLAGAAGASSVTGRLPRLGRTAGFGAALLGPAMATYTAVLLADTAVPAWHEAYRELPFVSAPGRCRVAARSACWSRRPHRPVQPERWHWPARRWNWLRSASWCCGSGSWGSPTDVAAPGG
ncbi:MAG: NrfD/PsrC family molybdoenzyme membrane anchor subunit, partial [Streptomycetales bacterium]